MMLLQRSAAAAVCALLLAFPASAQLIGSGHVLGNGTSSPAAPADTPLIQIMNQSGSGIGAGVSTILGVASGSAGSVAKLGAAPVNGNCASFNSSGGLVPAGGACTVGGGGGTVTTSTAGQIATYPANGNTVSGVFTLPGAYTWTGINSYTATAGGVHETGAPNITSGFQEPQSLFGHVIDLTAVSTSVPENDLLINMTSATGAINLTTAFKRALSVTAECNSGSASCWDQTDAVQLSAGGTKRGGIGVEVDVNNLFGAYTLVGPYAANYFATGQNNAGVSSFAYGAEFVGAAPMWVAAFHVGAAGSVVVSQAAFEDDSNSPNIFLANGTHAQGINFGSASFSGEAWISPGSTIDGSGNATFQSINAVNGAPSCSGVPTSSFHVTNGIVTHC